MAKEKLWGGRFHEGTAASVEAYTQSISYDWALYKQDIAGSCAHARMLARQGILTPEEADQLVAGLAAVRAEIEVGFRCDTTVFNKLTGAAKTGS